MAGKPNGAELPPGVRSYWIKGDKTTYFYFVVDAGRDLATGRRRQSKVRYHPDTGERFRTQKAAKAAMEAERVKRRSGGYVDPSKQTLGDYLERWLVKTDWKRRASTNAGYRDALLRIKTYLYDKPLGRLETADIQRAYHLLLDAGYAVGSIRFTHAVLGIALRRAVRDRLLAHDPSADASVPHQHAEPEDELDGGQTAIWTAEETARFMTKTHDDPDHALWMLLFNASLRIGEALALTWGDIDLEAGVVVVRRTLTKDENNRVIVGSTTKTRSSRRRLGISEETVTALRDHQRAQARRRAAMNGVWHEPGFVFDRGDGQHFNPGLIRKHLAAACVAAEVPRITPHGLRHTGTTLAAESGVPLRLIADRLGHKTTALVDRVYTHPTPVGDQLVNEVLSRIVRPNSGAP